MSPRTAVSRPVESLLDEVYLLILTRRPSPTSLAQALGVSVATLNRALRRLSRRLKPRGLRVASSGRGARRQFQIEVLAGPKGRAVAVGPETLRVRKLPVDRSGLKVDDEIIYTRDW